MIRCRKCNRFRSQLENGPCPHCPKPAAPAEPSPAEKRKGWATPYGFGDWAEPITHREAVERMKEMAAQFWAKKPEGGSP